MNFKFTQKGYHCTSTSRVQLGFGQYDKKPKDRGSLKRVRLSVTAQSHRSRSYRVRLQLSGRFYRVRISYSNM